MERLGTRAIWRINSYTNCWRKSMRIWPRRRAKRAVSIATESCIVPILIVNLAVARNGSGAIAFVVRNKTAGDDEPRSQCVSWDAGSMRAISGAVKNIAIPVPSGNKVLYHQPADVDSTQVRRSSGCLRQLNICNTMARRRSFLSRLLSSSSDSRLRPVASTRIFERMFSVRHTPPSRAHRTDRFKNKHVPALAASPHSIASNCLRSTCHPQPNGLPTKSTSVGVEFPHIEIVPGDSSGDCKRNASHNPRLCNIGLTSGGKVSPGRTSRKDLRSNSATRHPLLERHNAVTAPAGPPPMTATSNCSCIKYEPV
jgi:hypothetical protein